MDAFTQLLGPERGLPERGLLDPDPGAGARAQLEQMAADAPNALALLHEHRREVAPLLSPLAARLAAPLAQRAAQEMGATLRILRHAVGLGAGAQAELAFELGRSLACELYLGAAQDERSASRLARTICAQEARAQALRALRDSTRACVAALWGSPDALDETLRREHGFPIGPGDILTEDQLRVLVSDTWQVIVGNSILLAMDLTLPEAERCALVRGFFCERYRRALLVA